MLGIGAHLHEVGHALGCPHQISGIMEHAYWYFNRTFVTAEPYSTRTKQPGLRPCLPSQECGWHRLDCLRFRSHPCFRAAYDPPQHPERGLQVWAVDIGRFIITARTGINFIELRTEGDPFCTSWLEYPDRDIVDGGLQRHLEISESDLRTRLPSDKKNKRLSFEVHSLGGERAIVDDVKTAAQKIKMPKGMVGFAGPTYGAAAMEGSQKTQVLFSERWEKNKKILTSVRVFHEFSVHGVELSYEDGSVELFGRRSGQPKDVPLGACCCRGSGDVADSRRFPPRRVACRLLRACWLLGRRAGGHYQLGAAQRDLWEPQRGTGVSAVAMYGNPR